MEKSEGQIPKWIPSYIYMDKEHKCQLTHVFETFSALHKLQKKGSFCDITIKVDDTSFQAHKVVLASCSVYFNTMFSSGFQESHQSEVSINGKSEAFQILLDFAYSGQLTLSMETVIDVLQMAHYLQFDNVTERCSSFLNANVDRKRVDVVGAIKILSVADLYGLDNLKKECKKNILKNFKISKNILQHMTGELMQELLKMSNLGNEKEVFDTTVAWLQHDWENRKVYAATLLQKIYLGAVPIGHLSFTVFKSPDLYAIPECKEMIDNVLKLVDANKPTDTPLWYTHPTLFGTRTTVSAFLRISDRFGCSFYETDTCSWAKLTEFPPIPGKDCSDSLMDSCITVQGKLYVARGTARLPLKLKCPQFLRLDTAESSWYTLAPMIKRRYNHPLVQIDGDIYAIGGTENDKTCCEVYNIRKNTWGVIPSMYDPCSVRPGSAVAFNGKIFVYAPVTFDVNSQTEQITVFLQMYSRYGSWSHIALFKFPAGLVVYPSLVVHDGKCYSIVDSTCKCNKEDCKWHRLVIEELVIDITNKTAVLGQSQDQAVIPAQLSKQAFRINQDVFVKYKGKFHKTGIKIANDQVEAVKLDAWSNISNDRLSQSSHNFNVVFFTFDKAAWM